MAMGKVKEGISASTPSKASKGKSGGSSRSLFAAFLANLNRIDLYKPMQGWYARVYTAIGLGVVVAAGAWKIYEASLEYPPLWRFGHTRSIRGNAGMGGFSDRSFSARLPSF